MRRKKAGKAPVRRMTVDEKLAEGDIRLLVAPLAPKVKEFFDRDSEWDQEYEVRVRPENFVQELGILVPAEWPWERLAEGQVFLVGEFEIVGERTAPKYFRVSRGHNEFLRLDDLEEFRQGIKWLYSQVLTGGTRNGESD